MIDQSAFGPSMLSACRLPMFAYSHGWVAFACRWGHAAGAMVCGMAIAVGLPVASIAQDPFGASDPFAAPGDATASEPAQPGTAAAFGTSPVVPATAAPEKDADPVIRMLRALPPTTPKEFAETLDLMARIQRWDEVGRYLDLIQKLSWTPDQLAELSRAGGSSLWFELRDAGSSLSEPQQKFVGELSSLPGQLARDPQWLDRWIDALASKDLADSREAQLRLEQAGGTAIARLCARLLTGTGSVPGVRLVESLLEFQGEGIAALRAACVATDPIARARVYLALAQSSATDFGVELGSALESSAVSIESRVLLADALRLKYGKLPSTVAVHDYLVARFERQLADYQLVRSRDARLPVKIWRVGADGQSVQSVELMASDRSLEQLAQLAAHRAAYAAQTHGDLVDCATVLLQHSYQSRPGIAVTDPTALGLMGLPKEASGSDFWKQVLDRSQTWQMHGASIRASQAIGRELAGSPPGAGSFDFIAACVRDSRPVIRYVAVDALARANLVENYNGSAGALEAAIEMSRLGQGPMALVIGLSAELRQAADQQLLTIGASSISVNSTQAALQILDQPYPIEMIMIVDRVPRNSLLVLVERLRHSRRGGSLPIAILTDELESFEATELARYPGVVMSVLSRLPDHMPRIVAELEQHLDVRPLNSLERGAFSDTANSFLATIASDRQRYSFYPLVRWEKELRSVADTMPTGAWLMVLGGLGTSSSQEQLMLIAADQGVSDVTRNEAAVAFARSIEQFGLLLGRAATVKAYDVYNALGPNDPVTVSALGRVLDAIETKTGILQTVSSP